jgi:hypothetical protein
MLAQTRGSLSSLNQWIPASQLKTGEHLLTADGTLAVADGGTTPKDHDGWMWDLTVPGNNDHDFYVVTYDGAAGILVHNCSKNQGIYIFDDLTKPGSVYIGKTGNYAQRFADHIGAGRLRSADDAICIHFCGDDIELRIKEHIFKVVFRQMGFPLASDIEKYGQRLYNTTQRYVQPELPFESG